MQRADLDKLLQANPALWRGRDGARASKTGLATGFPELDAALPGGGWPMGALVEIVASRWGIGELRLLLPAMAALSFRQNWIVWMAPPYIPYASALAAYGVDLARVLFLGPALSGNDKLWSMEQVLRAEACGMALAWPERLGDRLVRRLQLAAEAGGSLGVLFSTMEMPTSPAALRIRLSAAGETLRVHILKSRGGYSRDIIHLRPRSDENDTTAKPSDI